MIFGLLIVLAYFEGQIVLGIIEVQLKGAQEGHVDLVHHCKDLVVFYCEYFIS